MRGASRTRKLRAGDGAPAVSRENIALLDRYLQRRFPQGKSTAEEYYTGFFISAISRCFEIRYRLDDKLIGVAIVDGSEKWLNAVYFYFDPEEEKRSPGTMNILNMINFCTRHNIPLLYLGYCIEQIQSMRYKAAFKPHELLIKGNWQENGKSFL